MFKDGTPPKKFMKIASVLDDKGYSVGHQIGEGTYSKVRTLERKQDGYTCAVKIIELAKVREDYVSKFMPRELGIILTLKHKNVIQTFEVIQMKDFVFQVMQYAEKGDVLQMIQSKGRLSEHKSRRIFNDIAKGIQYMHSINVAHRDLKCENILIFKDNSAAVSDFGFAKSFGLDVRDITCRTFCGSHAYAPPELLRGIPYDPKMSDVWSMGVILFTMVSGIMPFDDSNITSMIQKQMNKDVSFPQGTVGNVSEACKEFVMDILEPSTNKRLSIEQMFEITWMKGK